jgi:hypothetical protein
MKLVMALMVRDEADIIEDNLRYHRAQGVDFFVVADTGSSDGTLEILEEHERGGILRLERIPSRWRSPAEEGEVQTEITRLAWEMDADWVIHNDADEFWWPVTGNLRDVFSEVPDDFGMLMAPRAEFVARPDGPGSFPERMTVRERRFRRPPRAAHRGHPKVKLWRSHPNDIWVDQGGNPRGDLVGRPALRSEPAHAEERELDLVLAPRFPIGIFHFPIRSFDQYQKKIRLVAEAGRFKRDKQSRRVREAFEAGQLDRVYRELTLDDDLVAEGVAQGWLMQDTELRDYLAACPAALDDRPAPAGSRDWSESRKQAELAVLEAGAGYALSRYLQTGAYKVHTGKVQDIRRKGPAGAGGGRGSGGGKAAAGRRKLPRPVRRLRRRLRGLVRTRGGTP